MNIGFFQFKNKNEFKPNIGCNMLVNRFVCTVYGYWLF